METIRLSNKEYLRHKPTAFIFGADEYAKRNLPIVKENYNVLGYLDNDIGSWNSTVDGVVIFRPNIVEQREYDIIVIAIDMDVDNGLETYRAIYKQLLSYGVEKSKISYIKKLPKPFTRHLVEIHMVEHCNLNCAGCDHFSPIAREEFVNVELFENDLRRLSELTNKDVGQIKLLGGEPLLHPELIRLIDLTRKYFDKTTMIVLTTNGLLLVDQHEQFWKCAKRNGLFIQISHYPIKLDIAKVRELSVKYSVTIVYTGGADYFFSILPKRMFKVSYDLEGNGNITENFNRCGLSNQCLTLKDGKLYTCPHVAHSEHFFKKFGFLKESIEDSIDIYKTNNVEELTAFVSKPIPFCRFCEGNDGKQDWRPSRGEVLEWTKSLYG